MQKRSILAKNSVFLYSDFNNKTSVSIFCIMLAGLLLIMVSLNALAQEDVSVGENIFSKENKISRIKREAEERADYSMEDHHFSRKKLILAGDYWCPYNCAEEDENQGFIVELAKRALYIYGVDIDYRLMPWHEALVKVEEGEIDGIIGISNVEGKPLVTTSIPLEYSTMYAFTKNNTAWVFDGIDSFVGKRLGIIMDYSLDSRINSYVMMNFIQDSGRFKVEDGKNAVIESIANLIDGESDIYVEDNRVVEYYINNYGLLPYIRRAGKINDEKMPIYIAFSKNLHKVRKYIRYLEEGVASLKATGEYKDLRSKYDMDKYE